MPESQHIEWKETWRNEFLKVICAFANAEVLNEMDAELAAWRRAAPRPAPSSRP